MELRDLYARRSTDESWFNCVNDTLYHSRALYDAEMGRLYPCPSRTGQGPEGDVFGTYALNGHSRRCISSGDSAVYHLNFDLGRRTAELAAFNTASKTWRVLAPSLPLSDVAVRDLDRGGPRRDPIEMDAHELRWPPTFDYESGALLYARPIESGSEVLLYDPKLDRAVTVATLPAAETPKKEIVYLRFAWRHAVAWLGVSIRQGTSAGRLYVYDRSAATVGDVGIERCSGVDLLGLARDGGQICRRDSGIDDEGNPQAEEVVAFDPTGKVRWSWSPDR